MLTDYINDYSIDVTKEHAYWLILSIVLLIMVKTILIDYISNYAVDYAIIMFIYYIDDHVVDYASDYGNNDMLFDSSLDNDDLLIIGTGISSENGYDIDGINDDINDIGDDIEDDINDDIINYTYRFESGYTYYNMMEYLFWYEGSEVWEW